MTLPNDQTLLLARFKAFADENRLTMMRWLAQDEYNVSTLAEKIQLTEPTVSHHLSILRKAGLVTLRTEGNQRFYRANGGALNEFKKSVSELHQPVPLRKESDNAWIDALPADFSDDDRTILRELTFDGRLVQLPNLRTKRYRLSPVFRWLVSGFERNTTYTEKEVNAMLKRAHDDFVSLRRYLVEFGYLRRERDGSKYWLADDSPPLV